MDHLVSLEIAVWDANDTRWFTGEAQPVWLDRNTMWNDFHMGNSSPAYLSGDDYSTQTTDLPLALVTHTGGSQLEVALVL